MSFRLRSQSADRVAARAVARARELLLGLIFKKKATGEKISQAEIARRLGVDRSVVHRQLNGEFDLTLAGAAKIAFAMGAHLEIALSYDERPDINNSIRPISSATSKEMRVEDFGLPKNSALATSSSASTYTQIKFLADQAT